MLRGKSIVDAMDGLVRNVLSAFEERCSAQVTFCYLSKAFNCINHDDLLDNQNLWVIDDPLTWGPHADYTRISGRVYCVVFLLRRQPGCVPKNY
ncbi:hypothetical protein J6590_009852 [Homalodisca vitripennis]|nr:hypothetical protein J6590_009852 [Homalodisca vitripennis]